jgi:DNA-binding NarL/FixJ family response regulator
MTILVVEDEEVVARVIQKVLVAGGYDVPEPVLDASMFDQAMASVDPDLVLLDIDLGDGVTGIDLAKRLAPSVPFLFLSAHSDEATLVRASHVHPAGYVVKPFDGRQLIAAVLMALARRGASDALPPLSLEGVPELAELSAREREVLQQLLQHRRTAAIARALFISPHTVRNHIKHMFTKLNVRSQQELLDLVVRVTRPLT